MRLQCSFFGSPRAAVIDGAGHRHAVAPRLLPLLALLVANAGRTIHRSILAETLWPDLDPVDARSRLRRQVHLLARTLDGPGGDLLIFEHDGIGIREDAPLELLAGEPSDEYFAGYEGSWLDPLRARYREDRRSALSQAAREAAESGDLESAIAYETKLLAADPCNEGAMRRLMTLRADSGDRAGAIADYRAFVLRLRTELASEPMRETQDTYAAIVAGARGFSAPSNIAPPTTRFVGREAEIAELAKVLHSVRLATIGGPGGFGKTRLSQRVAIVRGAAYPDGVWFADVSACRSADALAARIAEATGDPLHARASAAAIGERFAGSATLVVLDGCDDCRDEALDVAAAIVACSKRTAVVLTSRRWEKTPTIALEPLGEAARRDLFLDRALASSPDFIAAENNAGSIATILDRSGGVPLAIELAAARLNLLTIEGLAKRMHDHLGSFVRSARTRSGYARTLGEIVAWSYDLLSEDERQLFRRLAVFTSHFSLESAQAVCGNGDIFPALSELVEASLLQARVENGVVRYAMSDVTRAFARERLDDRAHEAAATEQRHSDYFTAMLERAALEFRGPNEAGALRACSLELSDLRTTIDRALRGGAEEQLAALSPPIGYLWYRAGYAAEGVGYLRAVVAAENRLSVLARALARRSLGRLHIELAEYDDAVREISASLEHFRAAGDERGFGEALGGLAVASYYLGRYDDARRLLGETIERLRAFGPSFSLANAMGNLGALDVAEGHLDRAKTELLETADLWMRLDMTANAYQQYANLSKLEVHRGDVESAIGFAELSVEIATEYNIEPQRQADALTKLAEALRAAGRYAEAWRAHCEAIALVMTTGNLLFQAEEIESAAHTAQDAGDLEFAAVALARARLMRERIGSPINPVGRHIVEEVRAAIERGIGEIGMARAATIAARLDNDGLLQALRRAVVR